MNRNMVHFTMVHCTMMHCTITNIPRSRVVWVRHDGGRVGCVRCGEGGREA